MPILSVFYGLVIRMYAEPNEQHHLPHIHVVYQGEEFVYDLDGNPLVSKQLPSTKKKLLDAWMVIHRDDLTANWELLCSGEEAFRIDPLR